MATSRTDRDLKDVVRQTSITLADLPPIMDSRQVAVLRGISVDALDQRRHDYPEKAIPFIRFGRLIRYLKADVISYLVTNRTDGGQSFGRRPVKRTPLSEDEIAAVLERTRLATVADMNAALDAMLKRSRPGAPALRQGPHPHHRAAGWR